MSGPERARQAVRDVGIGAGTVLVAGLLTLWGSLAAVQAVYLAMTVVLLFWAVTARLDRLRTTAGWPRPVLFGGMGLLLAVNASVFSFTGFPVLLVGAAVVSLAAVAGLVRVVRSIGRE